MFDKNGPFILWISPSANGSGDGTFENPFGAVERALAMVKPGATIMLKGGVYRRDMTFDISGTPHQPIRIVAEQDADVEILNACWFFYDVSDLIVSNLTFRDAPSGAVSVIGACSRNRFDSLRFVDCGARAKESCTFFFGGSGGSCNVVENCRFERAAAVGRAAGLMVSEGDSDGGAPLTNHVFRKNCFVNYDYGILAGTGDAPAGQYGHIIEYNTLEQCRAGGILVKCGDTLVRGNRVERCPDSSISIGAGKGSVVESNRILDCARGIAVRGDGHSITNNCIVRCGSEAVRVYGAAFNVLVENNTCIDCGTPEGNGAAERVAGIRIDEGSTSVVRQNLFYGEGKPVAYDGAPAQPEGKKTLLIKDNVAAGRCKAMDGVAAAEAAFKNSDVGDFTNDSGYGAGGWVLTPDTFDPQVDEADTKYCESQGAFEDPDDGEPETAETDETAESAGFNSFMGRFYSKDVTRDNS